MEKRFLIVCLILIGILPIVSAIPTGSIVYGQSEGIVRSTTLPSENVHALAQQEEILTAGQLSVVQQKISAVQSQLDDIKSTTASQRAEITSQLAQRVQGPALVTAAIGAPPIIVAVVEAVPFHAQQPGL